MTIAPMSQSSPYLNRPTRLADVLTAIQVFATHPWDSRKIDEWKMNLGDQPQSGDNWEIVLSQHPEFFGTTDHNGIRYHFLRLRWAYERTVDISTSKDHELTGDDLIEFKKEDSLWESKLSRKPLSTSQTETLIKAAIELHARAVAQDNLKFWWIPLASVALGALIAIGGGLLLKTGNQTTAPTPKASAMTIQSLSGKPSSIVKAPLQDHKNVPREDKHPKSSFESYGSKRFPGNTSAISGP